MKKSLVALAALAAAGVASAQSSVTLFGILDTGISHYSNRASNNRGGSVTSSMWGMSSSGMESSRLGFRGTEDLGGGLQASFWLEGQIGTDTGAVGAAYSDLGTSSSQFFNRRSTVSLAGNFGEVRLGRDYTPTFWNHSLFDPFGLNGVGTNLVGRAVTGSTVPGNGGIWPSYTDINGVRANNSIGYFLPGNLGGFYGQAMYAFSERATNCVATATSACSTAGASRYIGGRVGYANGPLNVALAYGESILAYGPAVKYKLFNLAGSWDFGVAQIMAEYSTNTQSEPISIVGYGNPKISGWMIGGKVPVGAGVIRASYSRVSYKNTYNNDGFNYYDPKANQWALGYVHNLSKRTALYATVARISNNNGAGLRVGGPAFPVVVGGIPRSSTGYDFGLRHSF